MTGQSDETDSILTEADLARLQASVWPLQLPTDHVADIEQIVREHVSRALQQAASDLGNRVTMRWLYERESCDWWGERPVADWLRDRAGAVLPPERGGADGSS